MKVLTLIPRDVCVDVASSIFILTFCCDFFCSVIVVTTQYLSPALHKNFSEADFDFKVRVSVEKREVSC